MYTSFFGLSEKPFAITPDPRYLYLSERHAEALAHLMYGINESGGFIQLTGEVGTGKTTIVRTLLSRVPHHADVAVILNPRVTPAEFLLTICEELGIVLGDAERGSVKEMIDALNRRLLSTHAEGRRVIVIVDEAQNLTTEVLEQVRLLTNLETATQKLLQIILIGQEELRDLLERQDLRQLAQRITGRYHLHPMTRAETKGYVRHRLKVAGVTGEIFTDAALDEVHRLSGGIPRVINVTCDRALLGAYTTETRRINTALVRRAASEVYGRSFSPRWLTWTAGLVGTWLIAAAVFVAWRNWPLIAVPAPQAGIRQPAAISVTAPASVAPAGAGPATASLPAATKPPPPPPVSLSSLLNANASSTTPAAAFRRLMSLWGTALSSDTQPCIEAARNNLACLTDKGSWGQLRALNRPAILNLNDDQGGNYRVVLTALDDDYATLALGEHDQRIPLSEISQYWMGEFTLVWRPHVNPTRELSLGMRGEQVKWLRRSLQAVRGGTVSADTLDLYDQSLAIAVQNFQRDHRLNADGVAGLQTQVVLDTALAEPGSPLLIAPSKRGS
jgi:general secretion pathway protein A